MTFQMWGVDPLTAPIDLTEMVSDVRPVTRPTRCLCGCYGAAHLAPSGRCQLCDCDRYDPDTTQERP